MKRLPYDGRGIYWHGLRRGKGLGTPHEKDHLLMKMMGLLQVTDLLLQPLRLVKFHLRGKRLGIPREEEHFLTKTIHPPQVAGLLVQPLHLVKFHFRGK